MNDDDFRDIRPDKKTTGFTMGWLIWLILVLAAIGLIAGTVNFATSWLSQPAKIYGVENVREQWKFAYTYNQSLGAIQDQFCTADRAVADSADNVERSQRVTQRIAIENNYARVAAQYDAALQNAFEGGLVRPSDVPETAAALDRSCNDS